MITPKDSGALGSNGWYTSDINVSWRVVDNESAISNQSGGDAQSLTCICTAVSAGGRSRQTVTIKRDATAPTIYFCRAHSSQQQRLAQQRRERELELWRCDFPVPLLPTSAKP